LIEISA